MFVLLILLITGPLWKPPASMQLTLALASIALLGAVAYASFGKIKPWARILFKIFGVDTKTTESAVTEDRIIISLIVVVFVLTGIVIIFFFVFRDTSAMRRHPKPMDEDFPEQPYKKQLERFSDILTERLSTLDNETKWDDYFFAPLEAEVEIISGRRSRKKLVDYSTQRYIVF